MKTAPEVCGTVLECLDKSPEAVLLTDAGGRIVYANEAFERLAGCAPGEAAGKTAAALSKWFDHPESPRKELLTALKAGKEWSGRVPRRPSDGGERLLSVRIAPVKKSGAAVHYLAFARDVTVEASREKRSAEERKLEALGTLSGQLAHDFNNLLTIIIGSMEMIMEEMTPQSVSMKLSQGILQASKESAELIKKLLVFARRQDGAPSLVRLDAAIAEAKPQLEKFQGPVHKLSYDLSRGSVCVKLEQEQFKQLLRNLVVNACEAMPYGGTIRIAAYEERVGHEDARGMKDGDYAVIEVSDAGRGFPPGALERLFEPFVTTKPKGKGSGLGLSMVYGIVKQHKGEIIVDSGSGVGSAFRIYLPKAEAAEKARA